MAVVVVMMMMSREGQELKKVLVMQSSPTLLLGPNFSSLSELSGDSDGVSVVDLDLKIRPYAVLTDRRQAGARHEIRLK